MLTRIDLLTLFPGFFDSYKTQSLVGKAIQQGLVEIHPHLLRDWAHNRHRSVDDLPYGGGEGMVFRPEPLTEAISDLKSRYGSNRVIYLSCRGRPLQQKRAKEIVQEYERLLLVCGRYEGIDQRVIEASIDEEISIGDYVLSGGEPAALVLMDALIRLIPGVIGKPASLSEESFESGLLEYPHYTRPEIFEGKAVPEVLLSGNHKAIRGWRMRQAILKTLDTRPDLIEKGSFSPEIQKMIEEVKKDRGLL